MRKMTGLLSIVILAFALAACGSSVDKRTFELKEEGMDSTIVYTHNGDKIISQTSKDVIHIKDLEDVGVELDEVKTLFNMISEEFQDIDGVTHKMEYTDSEAIQHLTVDFEKIDLAEADFIPGLSFDESDELDKSSMEKHADNLEEQGYTEIK